METIVIDEFNADINRWLNKVVNEQIAIHIDRGNEDHLVLMPFSEYNSIMTTTHELSSRKNDQRLDAAIEKLES